MWYFVTTATGNEDKGQGAYAPECTLQSELAGGAPPRPLRGSAATVRPPKRADPAQEELHVLCILRKKTFYLLSKKNMFSGKGDLLQRSCLLNGDCGCYFRREKTPPVNKSNPPFPFPPHILLVRNNHLPRRCVLEDIERSFLFFVFVLDLNPDSADYLLGRFGKFSFFVSWLFSCVR